MMYDENKVYEDLKKTIDNAAQALENFISLTYNLTNINVSKLVTDFENISLSVIATGKYQTDAALASNIFIDTLSLLASALAIADIAFKAFNVTLNINPIMLTVSTIASLAVALLGLKTATDNQTVAELSLAEAAQKAYDKHQKFVEKGKEAAIAINSEMDYYQQLRRELDTLAEANGKVIKGNEERAKFITSTLSKVTGEEISITDNMIDSYERMSNSIDKLIEKKRAEAILSAHEEEYQSALKNRAAALKNLTDKTSELSEEERKKDEFIKEAMKTNSRYFSSETDSRNAANKAWDSHIKKYKEGVKTASNNYEDYKEAIKNYNQATTDFMNENYEDIEKTIEGTNVKYAAGISDKQEMLKRDVNEEFAILKSLDLQKDEMSTEQYNKERAMAEQNFLDKQNDLFAVNNAVWENSDAYMEAVGYLSSQGMAAYDEYGNLTEAARMKIESLRLTTLELAPEYANALMEMANSGQAVFTESGELSTGAQLKLINTFTNMNEISPKYSEILTNMANNGQLVFDTNGEITTAAQNKLIGAYGVMNGLAPEYTQKLYDMVNNGEAVFDANGNLTESAKDKIKDAKQGISDNKHLFEDSMGEVAKKGKEKFEETDSFSLGSNFVDGLSLGVSGSSSGFLANVRSLAVQALGAVKAAWRTGSPSKETKDLAKFFVQGLELGTNQNKHSFLNSVDQMGQEAISQLESSFETVSFNNLANKMRAAVMQEQHQMASVVDATIRHEVSLPNKIKVEFPEVKGTIRGNIENHILMDGRETAIQLTPFISEELAFSGM